MDTSHRAVSTDNSTPGNITDVVFDNAGISTLAQVTLGVVIVTLALVSISGNVVTCLIVYRKTAMRSAINLLLTNMALADITISVTLVPYILYRLVKGQSFSSLYLCFCISFIKDTVVCVVAYTMLVISFDRYLIIVRHKDRLCPKTAKVLILIIWCFSSFLSFPQLLGIAGKSLECNDLLLCCILVCSYTIYAKTYITVLSCCIYFVPVFIMVYLYAAILRAVQKTSKRVHNHPGSSVSIFVTQYSSKLGLPTVAMPYRFTGDMTAKRRAFGTILILFIMLLVCWLPYMINRTVAVRSRPQALDFKGTVVMLSMGLLKSALYPLIYSVRNKKFRIACIRLVPSSLRIPEYWYKCKDRRVNPESLYECTASETRF